MFKNLINLLFPKVCMGCKSFLLTNETVICTTCRHEIPLTQHTLAPENEAFKKFYGRIPVAHASALMYYHKKGIVQEIIHSLKYRGQEEIGTVFGHWYAEDLKATAQTMQFDEIIPVPLHKKRMRERGYNQVTTFGKGLSDGLTIPYNPKLLQRTAYSKTQSKKNLLGRTEIDETVFDVTFDERDHNKHFLLIDDVLTTGSTLEACGRALLKIPGAKVSIACMAMSHS
ncbi:ComF family protein [Flavobacterium sp. GT3R68]|uniref:ComF family protein n=1 Tax=Flavobacterium sp. GT3R68 TaxID=2594437 RepID=UPI000F882C5B|nr:phosphoribosyltransferase family protein [Flavobacterium sp. GT3R68]RTY95756.1 ComF family protein [Flavobacterium sp. GSN2]TRW93527.1 ComF family protein [Flavobacterium sp. GT3R68]